ncbi:MAG: hypothetical protein KIT11_02150 [Fimbriimonadaceae bacterium]|nr:hypothetical protein [Fimbriimonadaceae bacterium]QYK54827.1 MAG: hypothetical protein KF733_07385 [Fimbriimonadaceae bacterium]
MDTQKAAHIAPCTLMQASSISTPQGYDELQGSAALAEPNLKLVTLTGEDRKGWLQGQITQDLLHFTTGFSADSCLVAPTGQLLGILRLWALPDRIVIVTEAPEPLLDRAKKFVVMEDVRAELSDWTVVTVQGPRATGVLGELAALPVQDAGEAEIEGERTLLLRSRRTFAGGWDVALPAGSAAERALRAALPAASEDAWSLATLEGGFPLFGVDTDAKTLPPELGHRFESQQISYTKGCYTGQEVLARIHSRGHTNRTWVGLLLEGEARRGETVSVRDRQDAGVVTRAALSPRFGWIAGAMVRNAYADPGTIVKVNGQEAEVVEPPFYEAG